MNRSTLLNEINELIESEMGTPITEEDKIIDSGIDSFGMSMVILELNGKYGVYNQTEFENLDFANLTMADAIDRVLEEEQKKKSQTEGSN